MSEVEDRTHSRLKRLVKEVIIYHLIKIPINSSAASMTAAPFSIVAMRISWPGQSTNDTCLKVTKF